MKSLFILFCFPCLGGTALGQGLAQITLDNRGANTVITFLLEPSLVLNMAKDGKITDWGSEYTTQQTGVYPKLEKYMGREEYYEATDNEAYRGKIKYIGRTLITYYTADDNEDLKGKVKTVGDIMIDYYGQYDDAAFKGYLRDAGSILFSYYSSFDDDFYKGKIRSVGSTMLTYYGSVDDKAYAGKIKNVDRTLFTYYSSYERPEYSGMMKSGVPMLSSGGIQYVIKNY
jgi:hypothetical protein